MPISQINTNSIANGAVVAADLAAGAALSNLGTSQLADANMAPGSVIQVVSVVTTSPASTQGQTYVDSGLSATITPSSATSKIYVSVTLVSSQNTPGTATNFLLLRNSTSIAIGDVAGSRTQASSGFFSSSGGEVTPIAISFLDSPNAASAVTYKVQIRSNVNGIQSVINRSNSDEDSANKIRTASTITLMEIAQ